MMRIAQFGLTLLPPSSYAVLPQQTAPVRRPSMESSSNGVEQESASANVPMSKRPVSKSHPVVPDHASLTFISFCFISRRTLLLHLLQVPLKGRSA